jgi:hypothetical protein
MIAALLFSASVVFGGWVLTSYFGRRLVEPQKFWREFVARWKRWR